jgi:hypothetical protein
MVSQEFQGEFIRETMVLYTVFFIGNQFCSFKTRLSVFKSNFKKRSFPWQHRAFSMETSPNPRGPEKREV